MEESLPPPTPAKSVKSDGSTATTSHPLLPPPIRHSSCSSITLAMASATAQPIPDIVLLPLNPLPQHLAPFLQPSSTLTPTEKRALLTSALLSSASTGQAETLEWLVSNPNAPEEASTLTQRSAEAFRRRQASRMSSSSSVDGTAIDGDVLEDEEEVEDKQLMADVAPKKWIDVNVKDHEGTPALVLCVTFGHAECVRVLIEAGANIDSVDKAGWTSLHWAVRNNDIPIVSYLLNHRASPSIVSHGGLQPKDLLPQGREGAAMRDVFIFAVEASYERDRENERRMGAGGENGNGAPSESRSTTSTSLSMMSNREWKHTPAQLVIEQEEEEERRRRVELALECRTNLDVELETLGFHLEDDSISMHKKAGLGIDDDEGEGEDGIPNAFEWDQCRPDQMLVFSSEDLPVLFDVVITNIKPVRSRKERVVPANALFLCARYASYFGSKEMMADLLIGAFKVIDAAISARATDVAHSTFWLSNCLLLLYYLRAEPNLLLSTADHQESLCDLINQIVIDVTRDVERRLAKIVERAMIDHEALPGFDDLQFEGDWKGSRFIQKLTDGARKSSTVMSLFGGQSPTRIAAAAAAASAASSAAAGGPPFSPTPVRTAKATTPLKPSVPPSLSSASMTDSPHGITSILSSTLFVLQSFEISPAIITQIFSQIIYWISCEVFNRMLTNKKNLCRSKAIQVRLNAISIEDWSRLNHLPPKLVSHHFAPLNQLVQWLQCLSSEGTIDGMIGTIQSLRALNPPQLSRAVRGYRYEVSEARMDAGCLQYLVQIGEQWEGRAALERTRAEELREALLHGGEMMAGKWRSTRRQQNLSEMSAYSKSSEAESTALADVTRMIDESFAVPRSLGSYCPPAGEVATGELLNASFMLPFAVPTAPALLVAFRARDTFGPFAAVPDHVLQPDGTTTPRSTSTANCDLPVSPVRTALRRSLSGMMMSAGDDSIFKEEADEEGEKTGEMEVDDRFVPVLPDGWLDLLDAAKSRHSTTVLLAQAALKSSPLTPLLTRNDDELESTGDLGVGNGHAGRMRMQLGA